MSEQLSAKVFRSGNSLALRLPRALGFADGDDVRLVPHADGTFSMWRESDAAAVLDSLYGSFSSGFMADGRGDIEQDERDWGAPQSGGPA
jgi:antitoxin VapB